MLEHGPLLLSRSQTLTFLHTCGFGMKVQALVGNNKDLDLAMALQVAANVQPLPVSDTTLEEVSWHTSLSLLFSLWQPVPKSTNQRLEDEFWVSEARRYGLQLLNTIQLWMSVCRFFLL